MPHFQKPRREDEASAESMETDREHGPKNMEAARTAQDRLPEWLKCIDCSNFRAREAFGEANRKTVLEYVVVASLDRSTRILPFGQLCLRALCSKRSMNLVEHVPQAWERGL